MVFKIEAHIPLQSYNLLEKLRVLANYYLVYEMHIVNIWYTVVLHIVLHLCIATKVLS